MVLFQAILNRGTSVPIETRKGCCMLTFTEAVRGRLRMVVGGVRIRDRGSFSNRLWRRCTESQECGW